MVFEIFLGLLWGCFGSGDVYIINMLQMDFAGFCVGVCSGLFSFQEWGVLEQWCGNDALDRSNSEHVLFFYWMKVDGAFFLFPQRVLHRSADREKSARPEAFVNQTSGSLLRALRELKRVDEILQVRT